ncbi:MAG: penicillin acylase family protein [Limisphaerales bacterium]
MRRKSLLRWLLWIAGTLAVLVLAAIAVVIGMLRASLPKLDGEVRAAGLRSPVTIERDDLGVPTITASNRLDMIYGLGFVHGQDRFFQMDLSRRFAAGELAALLGPSALGQDRWARMHQERRVATQALAALPNDQQQLAAAYADGINAGLASLGARPPEYWALRTAPQAWRPEDALLCVIAMALGLTDPPLDRLDTLLRREIGDVAFDFFYPGGTDWDAALDGSVIPAAPMPGPEVLDFREGWDVGETPLPPYWKDWVQQGRPEVGDLPLAEADDGTPRVVPGSNGWAVDGSVSANRSALVASDMHLDNTAPGACYRVRLRWPEGGRTHEVVGLTIAGIPGMATGSNGRVAWAPTAAHLDAVDQVLLEIDPNDPSRYRVPEGWATIEKRVDRIEVRGGQPVERVSQWTRWGPVLEAAEGGGHLVFEGRPVVFKRIYHNPEAVDVRFFELMLATNTAQALGIAAASGAPPINVLVGDRQGQVGWTLAGRFPRRVGLAGRQICSWASGSNHWDGWLKPEEHPRAGSPEVSRVFSGNQRKLGTAGYRALARADHPFGARARQIRDDLAALTNATVADMVAIQLDDRALLLEPWRRLLLDTLRHPRASAIFTNDPVQVAELVTPWNGRATPDSVAYRLVRGFRDTTTYLLFEPLTERANQLMGQRTSRHWGGAERPVWTLLDQRPPHLLSPRFSSYDELLLTALNEVVTLLRAANAGDLSRATWGQYSNRPIRHPFSEGMPALSRWLDLSADGSGGGEDMPRIGSGEQRAVNRLVVSPGHEDQGVIQMLGGQSGHFLSPYYRAGHEAWVKGETMPLLPGLATHTLRLQPRE